MDNGQMERPCEQTNTTENITFPPYRWRVVIKYRYSFVCSYGVSVCSLSTCICREDEDI